MKGVSVSGWAGVSVPAAAPDFIGVEKQAAYYTDIAGRIGIRK